MSIAPRAVLVLLLINISPEGRAQLPVFTGGTPLSASASTDPILENRNVPPIAAPAVWDHFAVFVWQHQTDARRDLELYRRAGIHGFHIDRGAGQSDSVDFARKHQLPYYVDHAADKGYLHLTGKTGVDRVLRRKELIERPRSLSDPDVIAAMKQHLDRNIAATRDGPVAAYSFDDEISLGSFNSPAEVDNSPRTVSQYRSWLRNLYDNDIGALNRSWNSDLKDFDQASPSGFEAIRAAHNSPPFSHWRLAPWMDWRAFMDSHFAAAISDLTNHANQIDPDTPAGFVGGQQPSAYGGFDYEKIARSVQFIEAYDIGASNEILRSFWTGAGIERRPFVQTFFSTGSAARDRWFLNYYLAHGSRGVIAWPEAKNLGAWFDSETRTVLPHIEANAATVRELRGELSQTLFAPGVRFDADPVAICYSMPSIRASWVTDVIPHGGTWPNRSSSLDNQCQSAGKSRVAWCKLLEDSGYQYNFVSDTQIAADHLIENGYRVLILNRTLCLSDDQAEAIRRFVTAGGSVIADHWCGLLDEHGNGRSKGALDDLFGLASPAVSYFGTPEQLCELNGEKYQQPYLDRLDYQHARRHRGIVTVEDQRPVDHVTVHPNGQGGRAVFLNLSPLEYFDNALRSSDYGHAWRDTLSTHLNRAGLQPRVQITHTGSGHPIPLTEALFWHNPGLKERYLCIVKNPSRQGSITGLGHVDSNSEGALEITLTFSRPQTGIRNLRTSETYPDGLTLQVTWDPTEALVLALAAP